MMERAGYVRNVRYNVLDSEGTPHRVLEIHILGIRYAIQQKALSTAIAGKTHVQVEELMHNYDYYLGATRGLGHVSVSGKALNLEVFDAGVFTVSLQSLKRVLFGKDPQAFIGKIPGSTAGPARLRRAGDVQQHFGATA